MNKSVKIILECLENVKEKLTDMEYKTMIDELGNINSKIGTKKYMVTFNALMRHEEVEESDVYEFNLSKKAQLLLRSPEFNRFVLSDDVDRVFADREFMKKMIILTDADEDLRIFDDVYHCTIFKLNN